MATRFWDPCVEGRPSICDRPYVPRTTTTTTPRPCPSTTCLGGPDPDHQTTFTYTPCFETRPTLCDQVSTPTTTIATTTTTRAPGPSCGIPCAAPTITNMRAAPECTALVSSGLSCGLCAADFGYGTNGKCQQCAANGQVCNRSSDCCDPNAECRTVRGGRNYFYDYCEVYSS